MQHRLLSSSTFLGIFIPFLLEQFKRAQLCEISSSQFSNEITDGYHSAKRRIRRTPAVWGDPPPDYSAAQLENGETYLYALLFVDLKISDHYRRDHEKVKTEVMKLAHEANKYFYQINLRLIIVDIVETMRNDLSLYSFEDYRNRRLYQLPFHNFAVLLSYRYAGGLAFVGGMCSAKSVMLTGFYPHNPEAMGSIFFHEVGHLIGVPHAHPNQTINVPNCSCKQEKPVDNSGQQRHALPPHKLHTVESNGPPQPNQTPNNEGITDDKDSLNKLLTNISNNGVPDRSTHCLRIPGFDHDCTLQLMANLVYRNRCLAKEIRSSTKAQEGYLDGFKPSENEDEEQLKSISLCGNGVLENEEECDCGLERFCSAWNCDANTCTRPVPTWVVVLSTIFISCALIVPVIAYFYFRRQYSHTSLFSNNSHRLKFGSLPFKRTPKFLSIPRPGMSLFPNSSVLKHHSTGLAADPLSATNHQKKYGMKSPIELLLQAMRWLKRRLGSETNPVLSDGKRRSGSSFRNERFAKFSPALQRTKSATMNPLSSPIVIVHHSPCCSSSSSTLPSRQMVQRPESINSSSHKLERPRRPPPPPPSPRLTVGSPTQRHITPVQNRRILDRPKVPPPPLPPTTLPSRKEENLLSGNASNAFPCLQSAGDAKRRPSTMTKFSSPPLEDDDRYSISHKFEDFDDDDYDSDFDENFIATAQD